MSIQGKIRKNLVKLPPIVIIPDKTYIDDTGYLIDTDVVVITNPSYHAKVTTAIQKEYGSRKDIGKAKMRCRRKRQ